MDKYKDNIGERAKVMERWQAAREQLATAIHTFRDASGALNHDFTRLAISHTDFIDLEENFRTLLAELPGLGEDNKKLNDTFTSLKVAINTSKSVTPISRLPMDVLSRIFTILVGWDDIYCHHGLYGPNQVREKWSIYTLTLSSVNAAWRRLMLDTPSFWSHIDICLGLGGWDSKREKYTRMCLERVKSSQTPIHLHISCKMHLDHKSQVPTISRLPNSLCGRPIASLKLVINQPLLVEPILLAWLHSSTVSLTSLKVEMCLPSGNLYPDTWKISSTFVPIDLSRRLCDPHLRHMQTLSLTNAYMEWHMISYWCSGLVDLELSYIDPEHCPSITQLRDMLSSNPEIRTLRFSHVKIGCKHPEEMMPIRLPKLMFLGLDELDLSTLGLLLRFIKPGTSFEILNVSYSNSIHVPEDYHFLGSDALKRIEPIGPFCLRHKVPMLSMHIPTVDKQEVSVPVARLLSSLINLRTLNLSGLGLVTKDSIDLLCAQLASAHSSEIIPFQPTLRRLRLRDTMISLSGLRRIVLTYSITWLRLDGCWFYQEDILENDPNRQRQSGFTTLPEDFCEWLKATVPELYVDSSYEPDDKHMQTSGGLPWWLWST